MGVSYVTISLFSTMLSYGSLHCWMALSPEKLIPDGLISQSFVHLESVVQALESHLESYTSIALVVNFVVNNVFFRAILSLKALLSAIVKRIKGFIKLMIALGTLHGALPDATHEELQAYDNECAICREPMAKAKKLSCHHLFHLACLRFWLDQGLNNNYLCPTCRKPPFLGRPEDDASPHAREVSSDEQLARQISSRLDLLPTAPNLPAGVSPDQTVNSLDGGDWRGGGPDSTWLGFDGAGPSTTMRSVGLGRVHMMMRHLAAVGETFAQTALEDDDWNPWLANSSQASTSSSAVSSPGSVRYLGNAGPLDVRMTSLAANEEDLASILAMAETVVREVLPHVPDELKFQDLQRTNSVTVTVNNFLRA